MQHSANCADHAQAGLSDVQVQPVAQGTCRVHQVQGCSAVDNMHDGTSSNHSGFSVISRRMYSEHDNLRTT